MLPDTVTTKKNHALVIQNHLINIKKSFMELVHITVKIFTEN